MKLKTIYSKIVFWALSGLLIIIGTTSCEEYPDAYKSTGGVPEIIYIRTPEKASADSLLTGAYLSDMICLVGNNLRSINKLYFNDQKAVLNTSFITDNTLIVSIPKEIPGVVTDKIYMITGSNDTVAYDFNVKVPNPIVNTISCEYLADNEEAVLSGDYFIDDPNKPLKIVMAGNIPVKDIISIEKTKIKFRIPQGAQKGFINVTTLYGTGRSHFQFRDDRGMILDWDNLNASGGWRAGKTDNVNGISGKYVKFKGDLEPTSWNEDDFSFNLWGSANGRPQGDLFDTSKLSEMVIKFEVNVVAAWKCCALQVIFTPWSTQGTNGYYGDGKIGRALWMPWTTTGSYQTDGWITVSIPISNFKFTSTGGTASVPEAGGYGGLSMFVWSGGQVGEACSLEMWIDNIRVVPAE